MTDPNADPSRAPRLYSALAEWWPLLSPPSEYVEEAEHLLSLAREAAGPPARTMLELGSGGGSLAHHLKRHFRTTLSDLSPGMLAVSAAANPDCEHVLGDMRSLRLGRLFDLVLIHDAICYATDPASVLAALSTAHAHCRPGGTLLVVPDFVRETFEPSHSAGGHDAPDGRGLRYLEWTSDPDPSDETYEVNYAFLLRGTDGAVKVEGDRHLEGLFPRAAWLDWLRRVGFAARSVIDPWGRDIFLGVKD